MILRIEETALSTIETKNATQSLRHIPYDSSFQPRLLRENKRIENCYRSASVAIHFFPSFLALLDPLPSFIKTMVNGEAFISGFSTLLLTPSICDHRALVSAMLTLSILPSVVLKDGLHRIQKVLSVFIKCSGDKGQMNGLCRTLLSTRSRAGRSVLISDDW